MAKEIRFKKPVIVRRKNPRLKKTEDVFIVTAITRGKNPQARARFKSRQVAKIDGATTRKGITKFPVVNNPRIKRRLAEIVIRRKKLNMMKGGKK